MEVDRVATTVEQLQVDSLVARLQKIVLESYCSTNRNICRMSAILELLDILKELEQQGFLMQCPFQLLCEKEECQTFQELRPELNV